MRLFRRFAEFRDIGTGDERSTVADDQNGLRSILLRRMEITPISSTRS
jgi:hypothetical protein